MKTFLQRLSYFGYYLWRLDWDQLSVFMSHVRDEKGWSRMRQWRQIVRDSFKFNISILEYYQFRFFEIDEEQKSEWAGTGTMYEYQKVANPPETRAILENKVRFFEIYKQFFIHELYTIFDLEARPNLLARIMAENQKLVFKDAHGNCGNAVVICDVRGMAASEIPEFMRSNSFDIVETFVYQHPDLAALSPSAVNTVRIITQITSADRLEFLGCRIRISIDSEVDNLAAGNMAAPIDSNTGVVCGPGVFADITRPPAKVHPKTGTPIIGFKIPYWDETVRLIREASFLRPENRSIGWDIAITESGPGLIEGNHDWCKLVWQLPVGRGLKADLE